MKRRIGCLLFCALILAACGGDANPATVTPTLQGAVVPTRVTLTPTNTVTPSPTATATATATPDIRATENAQATLDARATAHVQATLDALEQVTRDAEERAALTATAEFEATQNAQATIDAQATLDALATADRQAMIDTQATLNAQAATLSFVETQQTQSTQNAQATANAQATFNAFATIDAQATLNAQGTLDALATRDQPTPTLTPTEVGSRELSYGAVVTDRITNTAFEIEYTFEGRAQDVVTITMENLSGDLDPYLVLLRPDRSEAASNDDISQRTRDARIDTVTLADSGTYTIIATRFSRQFGSTTGEYQLTLERSTDVALVPSSTPTNTADAAPDDEDKAIAYGESRSGLIDNDTPSYTYTFEGEAGDVITIRAEATSGDLDTIVSLLDNEGRELAFNDDADEDTRNSRIDTFTLPDDGTYSILLTRFNRDLGLSSGEFALTLEEGEGDSPPPTQQPPPPTEPSSPPTGDGTIFRGVIDDDQSSAKYVFEGQAGDVVTIRMRALSGDLDTLLLLLDASGDEVAANDDANSDTRDSLIEDFELPRDSTYTIVATRFSQEAGLSSGEFELILEGIDIEPSLEPAEEPEAFDIRSGQIIDSFQDEITQVDFFRTLTFDGEAGQVITVNMDGLSGDLDPYLVLLDSEGRPLARNDDRNSEELHATLDNIVLPTSGEYTVVAARFQQNLGDSIGAFEVEVRETEGETQIAEMLPQIEVDLTAEIDDEITDDTFQLPYVFFAKDGDVLRVQMLAGNDVLDPYLELVDAFGNELTYADDNFADEDSNSNAYITGYVIPEDGYYILEASVFVGEENTYNTGPFTLMIERQPEPDLENVVHGLLIDAYSFSQYGDDGFLPYLAAGDWLVSGQDENIFAVLTYWLPSTAGDVAGAELDLVECVTSSDDLIELFGPLTMYFNTTYTTTLDLDSVILEDREELAMITECEAIDVTGVVQAAYNEGERFIQFQLAFDPEREAANQTTDSVVFTYPVLAIGTE